MALIYGLIHAFSAMVLKWAKWKNARAMKRLEAIDVQYRKQELQCKGKEVSTGRPATMLAQMKLMRLIEQRDDADNKFKSTATQLNRRQRFHKSVVDFQGKKLPYSLGLIDMALVMKLAEWAFEDRMRWQLISDLIARF